MAGRVHYGTADPALTYQEAHFMKYVRASIIGLALTTFALGGCKKEATSTEAPLTSSEALEAVTESSASSQASELTATSVELNTNFTIGGAVEKAAEELKTFIGTQLPCADVTLVGAKLTVKYGVKPGNCEYRGHQFSGETTVTITRNDTGDVIVDHTWDNLSNGLVKVSGTAHVTWSTTSKSRRVQHELTWTRVSDARTGKGTGDRTETLLEGGLAEGIKIEGTRSWQGQAGTWDLAIKAVEIRWADPVPQAGSYVLHTPKDKTLTMSFSRVDGDTIKVTVTNGTKTFSFNVNKIIGDVSQT
jgi:hypothetical protein